MLTLCHFVHLPAAAAPSDAPPVRRRGRALIFDDGCHRAYAVKRRHDARVSLALATRHDIINAI